MGDWSMLPSDILGEIALKLDQLEDFVYFSAVCHSWNYASSLVKPIWNFDKVTPWLLLAEPEKTSENPNNNCVRKAYNLTCNKTYKLKLPDTFGLRCWGSPFGWIVIQTVDYQVHLFNPLTNVRITSFPSILSLDVEPFKSYEPDDPVSKQEQEQWFFKYFVTKFVVLKMRRPLGDGDGDGDGDLLLAILYILGDDAPENYLAVARPGDQAWTCIDDAVEDVVCRGDLIYILRIRGELAYCDMKKRCSSSSGGGDLKVVEYVPRFCPIADGLDKVHLLDLCGDLVIVLRRKKSYGRDGEIHPFYSTSYFIVFRLDNKAKKWVIIKDIGNYSIFVGNNTSMAVPIPISMGGMPNNYGVRKNSIYFTDNEDMFWNNDFFGGLDMGVYNICSGDITPFYQGDDTRSPFCPPFFFKPTC